MKLLVVTPYYHPKIGGLEVYARQLSIALHDIKQWDIAVVTSNDASKETVVDTVDGMKVHRLGVWKKLSNTPVNLLWPFMIRKVIREEQPDVILAHTPVPSMADAAALASGKTPLILVDHAATLMKGDSLIFKAVVIVYGMYQRLTFTRAKRILAVSEYVKDQLPAKVQGKARVLPNAVWEKQIKPRRQPTTTPNFLFIGSLDRTHFWKGLEDIIRAMHEYRRKYKEQCTLTVMGDGNNREVYEALVRELKLDDAVSFIGAKSGVQKDRTIRKATALVMYPTTANDAFPTVMLEAWANGVPVIASAIGPIPSLINHGTDGYLVTPSDPKALAKMLHTVAQSPTAQRQKIATAALERTRNSYTWEKQADTVEQIVGEIL